MCNGYAVMNFNIFNITHTHTHAHTRTHFDNGFSVNSIPRSKMVREQKGGRVRGKVLFNKCFAKRSSESGDQRLQSGGKPVWGKVA